ncbi:MAG: surface-adhesin E family protein [Parasphingorhabdus sp.]|uniref:surface-adhesin E family protein n=1 Tax=Parasphingorhabdus sp. TaxID=2709688 RepID=UPI0032974638
MIKVIRKPLTSIVLTASLLVAGPSCAKTKAAAPDWYLVDEIIEDKAPDYRSDIFFADKASIKQEDGYTAVSISQIIMTQDEETSESKVRDLRSRILIDCNEHVYAATEVAEYSKDNKLVTSQSMSLESTEWILPFANSGYVNVFRFACEPDITFGTQKFPGHIQPLTSVMAYLNADWRN